jgi:adenylate cyclase
LTSQAASALENAHLYERVEKARAEEAQLLEVTNAIASELHLDALLTKIISVTTSMLEADRSSLFLYDKKTNELWSRVAEGLQSKEIRIPSSAGIAGACFTSGETINIPDSYADPRFNPAVDKKTGYHTRTILCMPVVNKEGE